MQVWASGKATRAKVAPPLGGRVKTLKPSPTPTTLLKGAPHRIISFDFCSAKMAESKVLDSARSVLTHPLSESGKP